MSTIGRRARELVVPQFALDKRSNVHGIPHWVRVANNGRRICALHQLNYKVTEWFAYLHDSCRLNDYQDPEHGHRAAVLAVELREYINLTDKHFDWLLTALQGHSDGHTAGHDMHVLACWDADRLDLPRVGIIPDPNRMCTEYGILAAESKQFWEQERLHPVLGKE